MAWPLPVSLSSPVGPLPSGSHLLLVTHIHHTPSIPGPCHLLFLLPGTVCFALINHLLTLSSWFTLHPKLDLLREACAALSSQITRLLIASQSTGNLHDPAPLASVCIFALLCVAVSIVALLARWQGHIGFCAPLYSQ